MRLFISSFKRRGGLRWLLFYGVFFGVLGAVLLAYNNYWLKQGHVPNIADSKSLWAAQRDKVYRRDKTPLVFLGASRTLFAIDMPYVRQRLPGYEPVMLALNGMYPLAALKDLALDKNFTGVVLIDIDSHGLLEVHNPMQQAYVDYFRNSWNPSWRLHRMLLNRWQQLTVLGDPTTNVVTLLQRRLAGHPLPRQPNFITEADRNSGLLLTEEEGAHLKKHFVKVVQDDLIGKHTSDVAAWASNLDHVKHWVELINSRGGQVVFYTAPVSGQLRQVYADAYPKAQYWDVFMAQLPVKALQAAEIPEMETIPLPDGSHMHASDKRAYTNLLLNALLERKML
ncbi:MAG TPA: hypothetical protein VFD11_11540 [Thiopseudomonas sp.]|nr:hypothetical protein [Thiopseudomonas sp.]